MANRKGRGRKPGWSTAAQEIVDRIFVYGTLRAGQHARALIADHVASSEPATMNGTIYAFPGGYPGFLPNNDTPVVGELVTLVDLAAAFPLLDAYEGDDFDRVLAKARRADDTETWAWVYVMTDPAMAGNGTLIPSGDWCRYLKEA